VGIGFVLSVTFPGAAGTTLFGRRSNYRPKAGDFDASQIRILELWRDLGGEPLQGKRGKAFWRDGDGYNVALDADKNVWHDKSADQGGGTVKLAATALGVSDKFTGIPHPYLSA
jgi:hypothetical protein